MTLKGKSLTREILFMLAVGPIILSSFFLPNLPQILKPLIKWRKNWGKIDRKRIHEAIQRLNKKRLVELVEKGGKLYIKITDNGKQLIRNFNYDNLELPKLKKWDRKWRLVVFDIPDKKNKEKLNKQNKEYYLTHKEQARMTGRDYYWRHRERLLKEKKKIYRIPKYRFYALKSSAKCRGLIVEINIDDFIKITSDSCEYCGKENRNFGIDRVDSSIGYLKENCASCCSTCNFMKLSMTKEQFLEQVRDIYNYNA